eukprot:CAMPEP_0178392154 /NCGR_PEP_ID=MMETSP0689_2-20121128/11532_1 /TAXON_ID=160604 /ORGANISM="Amphidinium massartii, Strain CS-259" /LENGTH=444 /DNA_ID=CAMNT_0020012719 /DNA_START=277 /DNA_END=1611 /DNA_ORIENTATION=+
MTLQGCGRDNAPVSVFDALAGHQSARHRARRGVGCRGARRLIQGAALATACALIRREGCITSCFAGDGATSSGAGARKGYYCLGRNQPLRAAKGLHPAQWRAKIVVGAAASDPPEPRLVKSRPGIRGEDFLMRVRDRGLGVVEILGAILIGPLAAYMYPEFRRQAADALARGAAEGKKYCLDGFIFCGGVPDDLQDLFKSSTSLLFSFLLGYTFFFLVSRQEKLYTAMYKELTYIQQIIEESPMLLTPELARDVLRMTRRYLQAGWWRNPRLLPRELVIRSLRSDKDPLEDMTRKLLEGYRQEDPPDIFSGCQQMLMNVRSLRAARADRLAASQGVLPIAQFLLLSVIAFLSNLSIFIDGKSDTSLTAQLLFGLIVGLQVAVLLAVRDLSDPSSGFYNISDTRGAFFYALDDEIEDELDKVEAECVRRAEEQESLVSGQPPPAE